MGAGIPAIDASRQRAVAQALRAFLPERSVLWQEEDTRPYECDGLTAYRKLPMVVALPETEAEVQRVLRACHAMGVPLDTRLGRDGFTRPVSTGQPLLDLF